MDTSYAAITVFARKSSSSNLVGLIMRIMQSTPGRELGAKSPTINGGGYRMCLIFIGHLACRVP